MQINIKHNFPAVARQLRWMREDLANRALASAMNKTIAIARTDMSREIRNEFALKAGYVSERLRVRKAWRSGALELTASLAGGDGRKRSANVIAFGARQIRKGVSVRIRKGRRKVIAGAFIANKGRTVFIREGRTRLPIKAVQTLDVAQMFNTKRINARVIATINRRFPQIFAHEAQFALRRARGAR